MFLWSLKSGEVGIDTGDNADGIVFQTNDVGYPWREKLTVMEAICDLSKYLSVSDLK